jgi:hypothetical protein
MLVGGGFKGLMYFIQFIKRAQSSSRKCCVLPLTTIITDNTNSQLEVAGFQFIGESSKSYKNAARII